MKPNYNKLKGQRFWVYLNGWRMGRVGRVDAGSRIGLRGLTLYGSSYEGRRADGQDRWGWNGPRMKVDGRTAQAPGAGVLYRRRVVPIGEWLMREKVTP